MTQGLKKTKNTVKAKHLGGSPTGYSAAGTVIQLGTGCHRSMLKRPASPVQELSVLIMQK